MTWTPSNTFLGTVQTRECSGESRLEARKDWKTLGSGLEGLWQEASLFHSSHLGPSPSSENLPYPVPSSLRSSLFHSNEDEGPGFPTQEQESGMLRMVYDLPREGTARVTIRTFHSQSNRATILPKLRDFAASFWGRGANSRMSGQHFILICSQIQRMLEMDKALVHPSWNT